MEKEELKAFKAFKAFKELTKVKNRKLLDDVIKTYCDVGMFNCDTILMMYKEELKSFLKCCLVVPLFTGFGGSYNSGLLSYYLERGYKKI